MYKNIDGTKLDYAENLDLVMLMYDLLEYSSNYSDRMCSLWFCSKDQATDFNVGIGDYPAFKSFAYKTKLVGETKAQASWNNNKGMLKNTAAAILLKYLNNIWRSLKMSLINCKVEWRYLLKWGTK